MHSATTEKISATPCRSGEPTSVEQLQMEMMQLPSVEAMLTVRQPVSYSVKMGAVHQPTMATTVQ